MEEFDNFLKGVRNDMNSVSAHIQHSHSVEATNNASFPPFQYPFTQFQILQNDDADKSTRYSDILTEIDGSIPHNLNSENLAMWKELKKLKRELIMLHLGLSNRSFANYPASIPIVINNNTDVSANSQSHGHNQKTQPSWMAECLNVFFSRPANRIIFIMSLGILGYLMQEKVKRNYLLSMVEDKIRKNPFLKTVYAVEEFLGLRCPPKINFF